MLCRLSQVGAVPENQTGGVLLVPPGVETGAPWICIYSVLEMQNLVRLTIRN